MFTLALATSRNSLPSSLRPEIYFLRGTTKELNEAVLSRVVKKRKTERKIIIHFVHLEKFRIICEEEELIVLQR